MQTKSSKGSSASKRANNKHTKQSDDSAIEQRIGKLETDLTLQLEVLRAEKEALQGLLEKTRGELRTAEARLGTTLETTAVETSADDQEWQKLKTVALSQDQILELQNVIFEFFCSGELDTQKEDLHTMFSGWIASKEMRDQDRKSRSNTFFGYRKMIELFEKLDSFYEWIDDAWRKQYRSQHPSQA